MTLQEALFFSSLKTAIYERGLSSYGTAHRCYLVQVAIKQEASQDRLKQKPEQVEDIFEISIVRKEGEHVYPPHMVAKKRSLDACIGYLSVWGVGCEFEAPWLPVETWEEAK